MIQKILILFLLSAPLTVLANCWSEERTLEEGKKFFEAEEYRLASESFGSVKRFCTGDPFKAAYFEAASFMMMRNAKVFDIAAESLVQYADSDDEKEKILLLKAYAYGTPEVKGVRDDLKSRYAAWTLRREEKSPFQGVELNDLHRKYYEARHAKKPWLAGVMSAVLPGSGQAYVGNYGAGIASLLINGLLLGTTLEFNRKDHDFAAVASGTLFAATYVGNIASAVGGAVLENAERSAGFEKALRIKVLPELEF